MVPVAGLFLVVLHDPDVLVAALAGRADLVKGFVDKDQNAVRARTAGGETALHLAAQRGHLKAAEVLVAGGADVNATNNDRSKLTPLLWAASYGHHEVVALLLTQKADRKAKSWDGKTALDHARESRDEKTIRLLEKEK